MSDPQTSQPSDPVDETLDVAGTDLPTGSGGETRQHATGDQDRMTTALGAPVADDQNWLTAGARGPARGTEVDQT